MAVLLSHWAAVAAWLSPRASEVRARALANGRRAVACGELGTVAEAAGAPAVVARMLGIDGRGLPALDVTVGPASPRRASRGIRPHRWTGPIPDGEVLDVGDGILLSSPELCLLQMAASLDTLDLAMLCLAMMGWYAPARNARGYVGHDPVTTLGGARRLLDRAGRHWGIAREREALGWAAEGARDPLDSAIAILLGVPRSKGGFGIGRPILNGTVNLGRGGWAVCHMRRCVIEVRIPGTHLALSRDPDAGLRDRALGADGYVVLPLETRTLSEPMRREVLERACARAAGKRVVAPNGRMTEARGRLCAMVLPRRAGTGDATTFPLPTWALPGSLC